MASSIRTPIAELNDAEWMVIDLTTGTVLGTNLVLVPVPKDETELESINDSDSAAFDYGNAHGYQMFAPVRA